MATKAIENISATTVVKASPGTLFTVVIVTAPISAGSINDAASIGAATNANRIDSVPVGTPTNTILSLNWPCAAGIVVNPGTGGIVSVSYS